MDTAKLIVRRIGEVIITGFSYIDPDPDRSGSYSHFAADENKSVFEMTAAQAAAAIETGGFEIDPSSKSSTEEESASLTDSKD